MNGASESTRLARITEPPTDPDNHLNDNCRQRGINCRPRNKLHVPVTASILVTRPPIAALAALPLPLSPHSSSLSTTRNSRCETHNVFITTLPLQQQQQQRSSNILLYQESSSSTGHRSFPSSIVPPLSIRTPPLEISGGCTLNTLESKRKRRGEEPL